jgi:glycine cleavage system pyridoxal-binding protein P
MVTDLTAMPLSNSSLLDEATAAAEGMTMCSAIARGKKPKFLISSSCHPQTIAVVSSRADGLGLEAMVMSDKEIEVRRDALIQSFKSPIVSLDVRRVEVIWHGKGSGELVAVGSGGAPGP